MGFHPYSPGFIRCSSIWSIPHHQRNSFGLRLKNKELDCAFEFNDGFTAQFDTPFWFWLCDWNGGGGHGGR
jgi:hypothetical protein